MLLQRLVDVAFRCGLNLTRQTDPKQIQSLIDMLKPQNCGKPLIRIGAANDGGYLLPDDLEGIEYCFSPGVSTVASFENQLAARGIRSFLADYSVEKPPVENERFTFDKRFLGAQNDDIFMTLASWKNVYLPANAGDLLLQMDIEGHEYQVLINSPDELLDQFRIIVIEFHELERLLDPFAFALYKTCFAKLTKMFEVVHIHPNNCCGSLCKAGITIPRIVEITFYNKRRITKCTPRTDFPHPLDRDNVAYHPPLPLPACWYG